MLYRVNVEYDELVEAGNEAEARKFVGILTGGREQNIEISEIKSHRDIPYGWNINSIPINSKRTVGEILKESYNSEWESLKYTTAKCPFCVTFNLGVEFEDFQYKVVCNTCWAAGPKEATMSDAVYKWNKSWRW